jgi:hypothetical protein
MNLLSLESLQKNICFTRYSYSLEIQNIKNVRKLDKFVEYMAVVGEGEFWTSAMDAGCGKNGRGWCSRDAATVLPAQVTWRDGHPNAALGECVNLNLRNVSGDNVTTQIASANCSEVKRYVCEVRQKGTVGRSLAVECMALWEITEGKLFTFF